MCGRFNRTRDSQEIAHTLQARLPASVSTAFRVPNYNVAPTQAILAATQIADRILRSIRWGLIPSWVQDPRASAGIINARAESLQTKPAFQQAFRARRCLIPATGIYEWTGAKPAKQAWHIHRADGDLLVMAGLWEPHTILGDTCTIITCQPSIWMSEYHHRMPVVLEPEHWNRWLDDTATPEDLLHLLAPAGEETLTAYPVSPKVNSPKNNRPEILDCVHLH